LGEKTGILFLLYPHTPYPIPLLFGVRGIGYGVTRLPPFGERLGGRFFLFPIPHTPSPIPLLFGVRGETKEKGSGGFWVGLGGLFFFLPHPPNSAGMKQLDGVGGVGGVISIDLYVYIYNFFFMCTYLYRNYPTHPTLCF
jgi:hypothetical protein